MEGALQKWKFLLLLDPSFSEVGRQLELEDEDTQNLVLCSVMGVKSPNTVMKRANAIMMYYRWHAIHGHFPFLSTRAMCGSSF